MKSLHSIIAWENVLPMKALGTNFIKLTWKHMVLGEVVHILQNIERIDEDLGKSNFFKVIIVMMIIKIYLVKTH